MSVYTEHALGTFLQEISKGNVHKHRRFLTFGRNLSVDSAESEDIIVGGGRYVFSNVAETVNIVSTSANDSAAGSGWQKCLVIGLDANDLEIFEVVTLNGTTPVATQNQYTFISLVRATSLPEAGAVIQPATVGSFGVNEGTITGTGSSSSKKFFEISPSTGSTALALGVVPADKRLFLVNAYLTIQRTAVGDKPNCVFQTFFQEPGLGQTLLREDVLSGEQQTILDITFNLPLILEPRSRFWIRTATDNDGTGVAANILGYYVDID